MACWGTDRVSRVISIGTFRVLAPSGLRYGPSHVAMVAKHWKLGPLWCESSTLSKQPCELRGERVDGCQAHPIDRRVIEIADAGGRVEVYRLAPIFELDTHESGLLADIVFRHLIDKGIRYDWPHVLLAGTRVIKRTALMPSESRDAVFCSEMVAAILMRLGRLCVGNPTKYSPADLLRELVNSGTYYRAYEDLRPVDRGAALRVIGGDGPRRSAA